MKEQDCLLLPIWKTSPTRMISQPCPWALAAIISVVEENIDGSSGHITERRKGPGHISLIEMLMNSSPSLSRNCGPSEKRGKEQREKERRLLGREETIGYKSISNSYNSREYSKDTMLNNSSGVKFSTRRYPLQQCQQQELSWAEIV